MSRHVRLTGATAAWAVLVTLVLSAGIPALAQSDTPQCAPLNPAFVQYFTDRPLALDSTSALALGERVSGVVPETLDLSHLSRTPARQPLSLLALPAAYDLRTLGKLTPIRNQGSCGSCWSFATMGSLESSLMPATSFDGSENNLKNNSGFDFGCCSGGNREMSTAYMARWAGPVAESQDPYSASSCSSPTGTTAAKHVQDVVYLPDRTGPLDNDTIKQAVMTYGAIYTSYYHSDSYYNPSTYAYYYNGSSQGNHAVCIVGWDDNFDKSKFLTPPPGNGAWIIRNSWGTYWGQAGYFYMSYYDSRIGLSNAAFIAEQTPSYDQVYQYDPLGWITSTGYGGNSAYYGNVFTATQNSNIAAASSFFGANNSTYEVDIYLNPTNGPVSTSGPVAVKAGTIATAGYHTVALDNVVPVTAGQKFGVVFKVTTPSYGYPIPLERPEGGFSSGATAASGQSYMSSNGTSWLDVNNQYGNTNVCVKAFTRSSGGPAPTDGTLSVTPAGSANASGQVGGPFSPASQTYTLTNNGGSTISWSASTSATWTTLSALAGTLAPGTTSTVTLNINSTANSLAAGSYSSTVTFTNTSNGNGNTTRTLGLTVTSAPTAGSMTVSPASGLTATGAVGGPFSPSTQSFTVTNTGGTALNWTAAANQSWISLSVAGGSLAAGASQTVTASINSTANSFAAGSYSGTVSFTNSTNGSGNTTRPVSLTISTTPTPPPPSSGYTVTPTTYSWIDPTGHQRVSLSDDSYAGFTLPFAVTFYGKSYTVLFVGSNGLVGFAASSISSPRNTPLPTAATPNAIICPYWDDLNPSAGGSVKIARVGTAPSRQIVISWVGVPEYSAPATKITCQAILCEGSNDIIFQYQNVTPTDALYGSGRSATVGIENETGTSACQFSCNTPSLSNLMALRFSTNGSTLSQTRRGPIGHLH